MKKQPRFSFLEFCFVLFSLTILVIAVWQVWILEAKGQVPPPPAQQLRSILYVGDSYRDFQVIWDRGDPTDSGSCGLIRHGDTGDLNNVYLRAQADNTVYATKLVPLREAPQFETWHWKAFRVENVPAGIYQVLIADRVKGEIKIQKVTQSNVTKLSPGERTNSLTARTGEQIRGYGTIMTGNLTVNAGATIVGLTIDGNVTGNFDNVVFDSCTFRRGMVGPMGENDRGCLFKNCLFSNGTIATCSSGAFVTCRFEGRSALGGHNFCNERSVRLVVINCSFRQTDRGLVLRSRWGTNDDNLYAGIQFNDINSTPNGGELLCIEGTGQGFSRNLLFGMRSSGCGGGILLFDSIANHNLINNCRVPIDIVGQAEQRGNIIQDSEVEYVRINWRGVKGAVDTKLIDVASIGFRPSARGQMAAGPSLYANDVFSAVIDDGSPTPSTQAIRVTVRDQGEGFLPFRGVRP